jgi:hypothetical protein
LFSSNKFRATTVEKEEGRLIHKEKALEDMNKMGNVGYLQFKLSVAFYSSASAYCSASMASSPFLLYHCRHSMDAYQILFHLRQFASHLLHKARFSASCRTRRTFGIRSNWCHLQ